MAIINNKAIRELFAVSFHTRINQGQNGTINLQDSVVTVKVWAVDGDAAITIVKNSPPDNLPWMGLVALQSLELLERHILNQPVGNSDDDYGLHGLPKLIQ